MCPSTAVPYIVWATCLVFEWSLVDAYITMIAAYALFRAPSYHKMNTPFILMLSGSLESLELFACSKVTNDGFKVLGRKLRCLTCLYFGRSDVGSEGFAGLLGLTDLRDLTAFECVRLYLILTVAVDAFFW